MSHSTFSLSRLKRSYWLDDEIINAYIELINSERAIISQVWALNSYFYPILLCRGRAGVENWVRNSPLPLNKIRRLIIPLHLHGNHWALLVIFLDSKKVLYLDVAGGQPQLIVSEIINEFLLPVWNIKSLQLIIPNILELNTLTECGVYVIAFTEWISRNIPEDIILDEYICTKKLRKLISEQLKTGKIIELFLSTQNSTYVVIKQTESSNKGFQLWSSLRAHPNEVEENLDNENHNILLGLPIIHIQDLQKHRKLEYKVIESSIMLDQTHILSDSSSVSIIDISPSDSSELSDNNKNIEQICDLSPGYSTVKDILNNNSKSPKYYYNGNHFKEHNESSKYIEDITFKYDKNISSIKKNIDFQNKKNLGENKTNLNFKNLYSSKLNQLNMSLALNIKYIDPIYTNLFSNALLNKKIDFQINNNINKAIRDYLPKEKTVLKKNHRFKDTIKKKNYLQRTQILKYTERNFTNEVLEYYKPSSFTLKCNKQSSLRYATYMLSILPCLMTNQNIKFKENIIIYRLLKIFINKINKTSNNIKHNSTYYNDLNSEYTVTDIFYSRIFKKIYQLTSDFFVSFKNNAQIIINEKYLLHTPLNQDLKQQFIKNNLYSLSNISRIHSNKIFIRPEDTVLLNIINIALKRYEIYFIDILSIEILFQRLLIFLVHKM